LVIVYDTTNMKSLDAPTLELDKIFMANYNTKTKEEDLALIKLKNPIENLTENTISSRLMKIGKATLPWKGYRANGQFTP